jgi:hypothetical protein
MVTREHLLEVIRIGSASSATEEQRQLAANACATLGAALGATPGQPLGAGFTAAAASAGARPNMSTVIDLINAHLRAFLDRQQTAAPPPSPSPTNEPTHAAEHSGS